ncbi:hypothetical protein Ct61P_15055 [Colletotrichum tofieldiae]|nr:hypothetical protein Ct61P_15055 [Colletotrichum tofieldiae]
MGPLPQHRKTLAAKRRHAGNDEEEEDEAGEDDNDEVEAERCSVERSRTDHNSLPPVGTHSAVSSSFAAYLPPLTWRQVLFRPPANHTDQCVDLCRRLLNVDDGKAIVPNKSLRAALNGAMATAQAFLEVVEEKKDKEKEDRSRHQQSSGGDPSNLSIYDTKGAAYDDDDIYD